MDFLFRELNKPINLWSFNFVQDPVDAHRVKIMDEQSSGVDFTKSISSQRSSYTNGGIDNLGIKNGHLAVIDLGDTKGGNEEGKEITLTLEHTKVRPLTQKYIQKQLLQV